MSMLLLNLYHKLISNINILLNLYHKLISNFNSLSHTCLKNNSWSPDRPPRYATGMKLIVGRVFALCRYDSMNLMLVFPTPGHASNFRLRLPWIENTVLSQRSKLHTLLFWTCQGTLDRSKPEESVNVYDCVFSVLIPDIEVNTKRRR